MKTHKVLLTTGARDDIKEIKAYIIQTFRYREYGNNFSKNIRAAVKTLEVGASGYEKTGYIFDSYNIYCKPYDSYMIFFIIKENTVVVIRILKDRMLWQSTLSRMTHIMHIEI